MDRRQAAQARAFAEAEFGVCDLGDARLNRRLVHTVGRLALDPERSIPAAMGDWAATKGAYRLFAHPAVTREAVLESHRTVTVERVAACPLVLAVSDSTDLNYSAHPATTGLGHIGATRRREPIRGVVVHSTLAVEAGTHRTLGVLHQEVLVRADEFRARGERSRAMRRRARESAKWTNGVQAVVVQVPDPQRVCFVFDREGDIFEAIEEIQDRGARFVIRALHNRRMTPRDAAPQYLLDAARAAPIVTALAVHVPAGAGRKARTATVTLRAGRYTIQPPQERWPRGAPREVNVVCAREAHPPDHVEPLAWDLLTSEPVDTAAAATTVVRHYCGRWKIEEWHKALKTGCKIEERQLEGWDRLDALLGIFSVIAWSLLALRDAARGDAAVPPDVLSEVERGLLRHLDPSLARDAPARAYLRAVAKLGGFLGRKSDGDPGWITLWRGMARVRDMRLGYQAAGGR